MNTEHLRANNLEKREQPEHSHTFSMVAVADIERVGVWEWLAMRRRFRTRGSDLTSLRHHPTSGPSAAISATTSTPVINRVGVQPNINVTHRKPSDRIKYTASARTCAVTVIAVAGNIQLTQSNDREHTRYARVLQAVDDGHRQKMGKYDMCMSQHVKAGQ